MSDLVDYILNLETVDRFVPPSDAEAKQFWKETNDGTQKHKYTGDLTKQQIQYLIDEMYSTSVDYVPPMFDRQTRRSSRVGARYQADVPDHITSSTSS